MTYQAGGDDNGLFQTLVVSCVGLNLGNVFGVGAPRRDMFGARFSEEIAASPGHDTCRDAATRWIEPPTPSHLDTDPVHPNAVGQIATAAIVRAAIESRVREVC